MWLKPRLQGCHSFEVGSFFVGRNSLLSNSSCKKEATTWQGMQKGANFCTTLLLLYHNSDWLNQQNLPKLQIAVYSLILSLRTFAPKSSHRQIFLKLWLHVENDKIRLKTLKKSGVTKLVSKIRRITDQSISRISSHSRRFWPDSLLSAYI